MRGDHSVFSLTFLTGEELLKDSATKTSSHCYLTALPENTCWKAVKTFKKKLSGEKDRQGRGSMGIEQTAD